MTNIESLFGGADPRCEALLQPLKQTTYERGEGLPIPAILGVIDILKDVIKQEASNG